MIEIIKAATKTGGAAIIAAIFGILTTKILASVLGPDGIGLYSVLDQVRVTGFSAAAFGGGTALLQGIASKQGSDQAEYRATVLLVFLVGTVTVVTLLLVFADPITQYLLRESDENLVFLVRWLSVPIALSVVQLYLTATLNGFRAIGHLAISQIIGVSALLLLAFPVALLVQNGWTLAFIFMLSTSVFVQAIYAGVVLFRKGWLAQISGNIFSLFRRKQLVYFLSIAATMFLVSQVGGNVLLAINSLAIKEQGLNGAGIFNAGWSFSMRYVLLVLTSFTTYYLPTLSRIQTVEERTILMTNILHITILLSVPLICSVIVLKPLVIRLLFSSDFLSALAQMRWMVIGDYLKFLAFVIAMPMLAYANMRVYFLTDTLFYVVLLGGSYLSLHMFHSLEGTAVAYYFCYILYLAFYIPYIYKKYGFKADRRNTIAWIAGFLLLVIASIATWNASTVNWLIALFFVSLSFLFSFMTLTATERRKLFTLLNTWIAIKTDHLKS